MCMPCRPLSPPVSSPACEAKALIIEATASVSIIKVTPSVCRISIPVTSPNSAASAVPSNRPRIGSGVT